MKFAKALQDSFIVHLKLRGIWQQNQLNENDFYVEFTPPYVYSKFISNQEISQKMDLYAKYADREEFSKTWAQKTILGMTDDEISDNNKFRIFDAIIAAIAEGIGEKYMGGEFNEKMVTKIKTLSISSLENILAANILTPNQISVKTEEEQNGEGGEEGGEGGDAGGEGGGDDGGGDEAGGDEAGGEEGGGDDEYGARGVIPTEGTFQVLRRRRTTHSGSIPSIATGTSLESSLQTQTPNCQTQIWDFTWVFTTIRLVDSIGLEKRTTQASPMMILHLT